MPRFSFWDIGGCNCCGCVPCNLAAGPLHYTLRLPPGGGCTVSSNPSVSGTLSYSSTNPYGSGTGCFWTSGCVNIHGTAGAVAYTEGYIFAIGCVGGCTYYTSVGYGTVFGAGPVGCTPANGFANSHEVPSSCGYAGGYYLALLPSGAPAPGALTLTSYSCSPLNLVFTTTGGCAEWTITP